MNPARRRAYDAPISSFSGSGMQALQDGEWNDRGRQADQSRRRLCHGREFARSEAATASTERDKAQGKRSCDSGAGGSFGGSSGRPGDQRARRKAAMTAISASVRERASLWLRERVAPHNVSRTALVHAPCTRRRMHAGGGEHQGRHKNGAGFQSGSFTSARDQRGAQNKIAESGQAANESRKDQPECAGRAAPAGRQNRRWRLTRQWRQRGDRQRAREDRQEVNALWDRRPRWRPGQRASA